MSINTYKRPTGYNFDGEPLLIMGPDGTTIELRGAQPVMDAGEENWAMIGLFTRPGWWGNYILEPENQVGDSNFDEIISGTITRTAIIEAEKEAARALKSMVDANVSSGIEAIITPRAGFGVDMTVKIYKPNGSAETLVFLKNGLNWLRQMTDPASARITQYGN